MSSTNIRVNAVEHCIWAKHGATYIRESQNTWGFRLWKVRNRQQLCFLLLVSRLILARLITPFLPTIFPSFLPAGLPLTLNSSFVRVYLFLNTNRLSTKISLLYLFLYCNIKIRAQLRILKCIAIVKETTRKVLKHDY